MNFVFKWDQFLQYYNSLSPNTHKIQMTSYLSKNKGYIPFPAESNIIHPYINTIYISQLSADQHFSTFIYQLLIMA